MLEKTFVGSKYIETLEWGTLDLAKIISDELNLCVRKNELPKGRYDVIPFRTNEGDLLKINACLDDIYEMSDEEIERVEKDVKEIADEYNRVRHVESFMENDRRFYNEDINIY